MCVFIIKLNYIYNYYFLMSCFHQLFFLFLLFLFGKLLFFKMKSIIITLVPVIFLFFFGEKYFVCKSLLYPLFGEFFKLGFNECTRYP